jgi:hypothetical protein
MKRLLWIAVGTIGWAACKNADSKPANTMNAAQQEQVLRDSSKYTTIEWLDSTHKDLGQVKEGDVVTVAYRFRNSGTQPLIITNVAPSCGCTTSEMPQEAVFPRKESVIKAKFNSSGRMGENHKNITVTSNTQPNVTNLTFHVVVTK